MATAGPRTSTLPSSTRWSIAAGGYFFVCAAVLLLVIREVATLLADVLVLPTDSALWFAAPVPVVGALAWWVFVERRGGYAYRFGSAVSLATALLTVLVWVLRGVTVWGIEGVVAGWPLILIVLVPTVPAGLLAGVPLMYARRRLADGRSDGGR